MASTFSCKLPFIIPIILLPIVATAQFSSNVTFGSSLVANNENSTWKSPSGEFAFGFRRVAPGGYLLAIWFDKIPEKTIVWSANRDDLAEEGSRIQLFEYGSFELSNPRGVRIWAASFAGSGVAYGAMLDTGNFVLAKDTSAEVWQSFDDPTDTLLPAQIFNRDGMLISSFSETNHSRGRFMFRMQTNGNLVLYTRSYPMNDGDIFAYWASSTVGSGFRLIFNQSGYIYLVAENGTMLRNVFSKGASSSQFYQRLVLEYDGVLRHYVYPKSGNSTERRIMAWSVNDLLPSNICVAVNEETGSGVCGLNSICSLGADQRPNCDCPFGYSLMDPNDRRSGCKPDFVAQSCDQESKGTDLFTFREISNTTWLGGNYAHFERVDEDWCRECCLRDCFCAVAIYRDRDCWKKKFPLSNGRFDAMLAGKALLKISKDNTGVRKTPSNNPRKSNYTLVITGSVLLGSTLLLLSVFFFVFRFHRTKSSDTVQEYAVLRGVNVRRFSFNELKEATNGFKEELGSGASSTVYKGALKDENGKLIAVKKLDKIAQDAEKEFKAEVSSISKTNHKNLVQLLGYCEEGENRLLVYEFMRNGSLANFLFSNIKPNWYNRVEIALSTAKGLCYLHEECSTQIIHCDIKPQNVLIDESHMAKISDFGLSKLLRPGQTRTTTGIRGTRGYVALEWFRNMPITVKVDVYSFGVLLLELLCCRKNVVTDVEDVRETILVDWAYDCYKEGTLRLLVSNNDEAMGDMKRFEKFVMIAIWCIQENPALRPNMKKVIHMLEGLVDVPIPPDPSAFIS